jgi:hypothetical protein
VHIFTLNLKRKEEFAAKFKKFKELRLKKIKEEYALEKSE